jgi:hypothetical protein
MTMRSDFKRRARESVQLAQWAGTPRDRDLFLDMARAWRGLAEMSEDAPAVEDDRAVEDDQPSIAQPDTVPAGGVEDIRIP